MLKYIAFLLLMHTCGTALSDSLPNTPVNQIDQTEIQSFLAKLKPLEQEMEKYFFAIKALATLAYEKALSEQELLNGLQELRGGGFTLNMTADEFKKVFESYIKKRVEKDLLKDHESLKTLNDIFKTYESVEVGSSDDETYLFIGLKYHFVNNHHDLPSRTCAIYTAYDKKIYQFNDQEKHIKLLLSMFLGPLIVLL